jgi:hypothetical protein
MPKVRMKIHLGGQTSTGPGTVTGDLRRGDVVEVSPDIAAKFLQSGYASLRLEDDDPGAPYLPEPVPW